MPIKFIIKNYNSIFAYHKDLGHRVRIYKDNYDKWTYAIALNENFPEYLLNNKQFYKEWLI